MTQRGLLLSVALSVLVILILWSPDFLWQIRSFGSSGSGAVNEIDILRAENAYLKSELAEKEGKTPLSVLSFETIPAHIYSRYPLNFKNELILDKGVTEGVREGSVVVVAILTNQSSSSLRPFLIGIVSAVEARKSLARTIFDYRFKEAVQIGEKKISGLMIGGLTPIITLVPKDARLSPGDVIMSAAPDVPYGLLLGRIKEIRSSSDNLFKEASLELPYDVNNLNSVVLEVTK